MKISTMEELCYCEQKKRSSIDQFEIGIPQIKKSSPTISQNRFSKDGYGVFLSGIMVTVTVKIGNSGVLADNLGFCF